MEMDAVGLITVEVVDRLVLVVLVDGARTTETFARRAHGPLARGLNGMSFATSRHHIRDANIYQVGWKQMPSIRLARLDSRSLGHKCRLDDMDWLCCYCHSYLSLHYCSGKWYCRDHKHKLRLPGGAGDELACEHFCSVGQPCANECYSWRRCRRCLCRCPCYALSMNILKHWSNHVQENILHDMAASGSYNLSLSNMIATH
jgi:hypothetical protein